MGALAERVVFSVADAPGVLECFEQTAPHVFVALSHLTVGDHDLTERLLVDTYRGLQQAAPKLHRHEVTLDWLVATAHRLYVAQTADQRVEPAQRSTIADLAAPVPDADWRRERWGVTLDVLSDLAPLERAVLHLHVIECFELADVATSLQLDDAETARLLAAAREAIAAGPPGESVSDMFRHAEIWLDDASRDQVRVVLGEHDPNHHHRDDAGASERRNGRILKVVALAAAAVIAAILIFWVASAPDDDTALVFDVPSTTTPATTVGDVAAPTPISSGNAEGYTYLVPPVRDAVEASVTYLSADLTEVHDVVPDLIVRYEGDKVGVAWTGPCNRPAAVVQLANLADGVALRLMTGAFPVLACTGMPDHWTMVIQAPIALSPGPILPLDQSGEVLHTFAGSSTNTDPAPSTVFSPEAAWYTSALVDGASRPWVYGAGCAQRTTRYPSPEGTIFEVRVDKELQAMTPSDKLICDRLADRQLLVGPGGATFPRAIGFANNLEPIDCHGPFMSLTDVPDDPASTPEFYDGVWSTWENCLVNNHVIFSRDLSGQCGWTDVHTVTFNETLGHRVGPVSSSLTYLRDPLQVVPGGHPPKSPRTLPDDAYDTGLRHGLEQLWLSRNSTRSIFMVRNGNVEEWPRLDSPAACG